MSVPNWIAVFRAEYFTTTAKFRNYRRWIPLIFLGIVLFFSYFIRVALSFISGDITTIDSTSLPRFYAIISIFSFFTLFSPLISPLSRSVYDGSSDSRRDISMSSPIRAHELLYGNLASNLVFFLPFYVMVGTISLSVFIGSSSVNPLVSSFYILLSLTLLVLLGLFGGTIVTPLVYNFIAKQRSEVARAVVTLFMSFMLMLSLPLLQFMITQMERGDSLGVISYLPFTLAATVITYGLYSATLGLPVSLSILLLVLYNIVVMGVGYLLAGKLFSPRENIVTESSPEQGGILEILGMRVSSLIPKNDLRVIFRSMIRASLRDVEHMSRLSIGVAATMFFVFALSPRGLFQGNRGFSGELENAAVLFALVLSASTNIYVEASAFVVQHKSMLSIVKSAPGGSRKFVVAKFLQMLFIQIPIFLLVLLSLQVLNFSPELDVLSISLQLVVIIIALTGTILGIYLVNPADNEEDITNFINLLIFYVFGLLVAVFPVAGVIGYKFSPLVYFLYFAGLLVFGAICLYTGIRALEEMDIETLSSSFSRKITTGFSSYIIAVIAWNIVPAPAFLIYFFTENIWMLLVFSILLPLSVPLFFWRYNKRTPVFGRSPMIKETVLSLLILVSAGVATLLVLDYFRLVPSYDIISLLRNAGISIVFILSYMSLLVVAEEVFFRGFMIDYLRKKEMSENLAIAVSMVIFASFHLTSIFSFMIGLLGGYVLARLRLKSEDLIHPIIVHLAYNLFMLQLST